MALRLTHRCLREWSWTGEVELELRDREGTLLARLEHNAGRYRLTYPRTTPILSWPDGDLELLKHRAESIALNALPPDPAMMVRSARDNATSHPMGPPLNRPLTSFDVLGAGSFAFNQRGPWSDDLDIPAFLKRELRLLR